LRDARNFVAEKNWEGISGLVVTDEIKWTIALEASRLGLGFPAFPFDVVQSILVYPTTYVAHGKTSYGSIVVEEPSIRLGEAWKRGPIVLAWEEVERHVAGEVPGQNVVVHEFAHVLDMANGDVDGIPVLESTDLAKDWLAEFPREYDRFLRHLRLGRGDVINTYGATNHAEFFAVTSELFFQSPELLHSWHPALAKLHAGFYGTGHYSEAWPLKGLIDSPLPSPAR
jgi:hypothetical protein